MIIYVLDKSYVRLDVLDIFESMIWTDKYYDVGEFELTVAPTPYNIGLLQEGRYLQIDKSERLMIIETLEIKTQSDGGNKFIVKGRSLASVLDRRIVLRQVFLDGSFQTGIQTLLNQNVINSIYPERNFPNFIFSTSTDPTITALTLKAQYYSENLLEVIQKLCEQAFVGFKLIINSSNQMVFSLYAGVDRSYSQITNPYVVFSPTFDNLLQSDYVQSQRYKKTYVLVGGAPPPDWDHRNQVWTSTATGLDRLEMYLDATDTPQYLEDTSTPVPLADFLDQLAQKGYEALSQAVEFTMFDGTIDLTGSYVYGTDFNLGDIVQMEDMFGNTSRVQIVEMTFSENLSGTAMYPRLRTV